MNPYALPEQHRDLLDKVYRKIRDALAQGASLVLALEGELPGAGTSAWLQVLQVRASEEHMACVCLDFRPYMSRGQDGPCRPLPENPDDIDRAFQDLPPETRILLLDHAPWARPLDQRQKVVGSCLDKWLGSTGRVLVYGTLREWTNVARPSDWPQPTESILVPLVLSERDLKGLSSNRASERRTVIEEQNLSLPWMFLQKYRTFQQNEDAEAAWLNAVGDYLCRGSWWDPPSLYPSLTQRLEEIAQAVKGTIALRDLVAELQQRSFPIFDWPAFWLEKSGDGGQALSRPLHPTIAFLLADWLLRKGGDPCQTGKN